MKKFKQLLALLLAVTMLAGLVPANMMPVEAKPGKPGNEEQTQVETLEEAESRAGSEVVDAAIIFTDLHTSNNDYKESTIKGIFGALKNTGLAFSSVTSGGDAFSVNADNTKYTGKTKDISEDIRTALGKADIPVNYVWSDHDRYAVQEDGTTLLDKTSHLTYGAGEDGIYGTGDDGNYYVYALSMGDLGSYDRYSSGFNSDARAGKGFTATVIQAIENFKNDAAKLNQDRPLFIVSHQPLFNRRNDNAFAEQWFDAINEVAEDMDVAFFFGHNHKYDKEGDYYYAKGSTMPVATGDNWKSYETGQGNGGKPSVTLSARNKTLNFTHMCAGYMAPSSTGSTSNTTRQGTVMAITIYEDSIDYCTYNNAGKYTGSYAVNKTVPRDHAVAAPEEIPVEKDALVAAIAAAEALNAEAYTDFTAVAEALAAAKTVAENENATQEAVDAAVEALNAAIDALEEKTEVPETPVVPEDTEITVGNTTVKISGATVKASSAIKDKDKALIYAKNYEDIRVLDIDAEITGEKATLAFAVPAEWQGKTDRIAGISVEEGEVKSIAGTYAEGFFTFHVSHFSAKGIALAAENSEAGDTDNVVRNNYPEYPNEGAVKVNKTGTGIDFQSSGIAQVEISASGVPVKKGADVIVMLDTSSSMRRFYVAETKQKRSVVLAGALGNLIDILSENGPDGSKQDIRVAIADFNGFNKGNSEKDSPYYWNSDDALSSGGYNSGNNQGKVYTNGSNSALLDADAFVDVSKLNKQELINKFMADSTYVSGTNYDYAFDAIYQLGHAITEQNEDQGLDRDLFVVFMSDGAPFQYNYFHSTNTEPKWNNWLQGTMTDDMFGTNANKNYYNVIDGVHKHWMAEAIKGDPQKLYTVIRKNWEDYEKDFASPAENGDKTMFDIPGLGAEMFSIAFCPTEDEKISATSMIEVIQGTASADTEGVRHYYEVSSATELTDAFHAIGGDIQYAAQNARFVDQMGDDYNLQMKTSTYSVVSGTSTTNKTVTPKIEIISYDIYTKADAGKIPAGKNIGDRKGSSTLQEVVIFNNDGTEAYSNLIDVDKDGIFGVRVSKDKDDKNVYEPADQNDNILGTDGVIYAKTFIYNTKVEGVAVNGVNIPTGTNEDGTTSGSTNVLPSETFYWKMGTVKTSELAMRYYVYLEGSMEGTRPAGSYPTNEYANLYYDNHLGNPCQKPTVSPVLAWKSANVSYAFYLVNQKGEIIVNQTDGTTGAFANKIAVTNPVVYRDIMLNSGGATIDVAAISEDVLPKYYTLYDASAKYSVVINSDSTGSWKITKGDNLVESTYVTHYKTNDASAYSNAMSNDSIGDDYTHTVVWFAVVWNVQAHPDTVVIDYGLPVDISVLANDMFGDHGKLAAVGPYSADLETITAEQDLQTDFGETYSDAKYGTATAKATTGKVRYTPSNMEMNGYDKFAYAVNYTGTENKGYYYDTVTVIPATTIYYEDNFIKFDTLEWKNNVWVLDEDAKTTNASAWTQASEETVSNTTQKEYIQQEDRPGRYSITDANNIYGYDTVNKKMATYSLGSAKKATANASRAAQASFTFYGTGFDIIGLTDSTTGTIFVDVYPIDADGNRGVAVSNTFVDTYYGYTKEMHEILYTYTNGEWISEDKGKTELKTSSSRPEDPKEGSTYTAIEAVWVETPDAKNAIYQVPVMEVEGLDYGRYEVVIRVVYNSFFAHNEANSYTFYLDAIRIYNPANDGVIEKEDDTNDTTILDAYKADGEAWPSYIELRDKLLSGEKLGNETTSTKVTGLVFIDGDSEVGQAEISDYRNYGPNNEVYLAPGQRVAFMVDTPENLAKIHIGIKSADGEVGTYTITNIASEDKTDGSGVKAGAWYNAKTDTIDTSTDMYYDLTGWKNDIIVISNTGGGGEDRYNTTGMISLTNIKSTYISAPIKNDEEVNTPEGEETTVSETSIYMTPAAAVLTLRTLNMPKEDIITPDEEVTAPEAEIFVPEKLDVKIHKNKVKAGEKVKVTVTTSADVNSIEINGNEVTKFKASKKGDRTWETTIKAEETGVMEILVVAYGEDGNSSQPIAKTVEVTGKKASNSKEGKR